MGGFVPFVDPLRRIIQLIQPTSVTVQPLVNRLKGVEMSGKLKLIMVFQWICLLTALGLAYADAASKLFMRFPLVFMMLFLLSWVVSSSLKDISNRLSKLEGAGGESSD